MITVHCDYNDDARMLTAGFMLPEPLPGMREPLPGVNGAFLLDLHEWLEGRQAESGVWQEQQQYERGNFCTMNGGMWHAEMRTQSRPGVGNYPPQHFLELLISHHCRPFCKF
jgi:hypothetical protein